MPRVGSARAAVGSPPEALFPPPPSSLFPDGRRRGRPPDLAEPVCAERDTEPACSLSRGLKRASRVPAPRAESRASRGCGGWSAGRADMAHLRGFANQVRAGFWVESARSLGPGTGAACGVRGPAGAFCTCKPLSYAWGFRGALPSGVCG